MKICSKCKLLKTLNEFRLNKSNSNYYSWCKGCESAYARDKYANDPKYRQKQLDDNKADYADPIVKRQKRVSSLKRSYNITLEEYEELSKLQEYKCAICLREETSLNSNRTKILPLAVDHDHSTKKVRGLLCSKCNQALGLLKEDIEIVKRLIKYLELNVVS